MESEQNANDAQSFSRKLSPTSPSNLTTTLQEEGSPKSMRSKVGLIKKGSFLLKEVAVRTASEITKSITSSVEKYEANGLNLSLLAEQKHGVKWNELNIKQQVSIFRENLIKKKSLIHPQSTSMQKWNLIVLIALIFTAFCTPFEVAFLETKENALFFINRIVDVIFLIDIILVFYTQIKIESRSATTWIRDRNIIAQRYLKGWFIIDFISILPFDLIVVYGSMDNGRGNVQKLKIIRIERLLKLVKLIRMIKGSRNATLWSNRITISYGMISLAKLSLTLIGISHWLACAWGLLGYFMGERIVCTELQKMGTVYEYVEGDPEWWFGGGPDDIHPYDGTSWISQLFLYSGKNTPVSPCNPYDVYSASLHWSIMTITSIGYGDVVPVRREEYFFGILGMLIASMTWAYIIGSFCGVLSHMDPYRIEFEQNMDALNFMMKDKELPNEVQYQLRDFFRESQHLQRMKKYKDINSDLSSSLQGKVALHSTAKWIDKVWFFQSCSKSFLVELAQTLTPELFAVREVLPKVEPTMYIIERGLCARGGMVYTAGGSWGGDEMLLSSSYLIRNLTCVALTYVEVWLLKRWELENLLDQHPVEKKRLRKCAIRLAVIRGIKAAATYYKHGKEQKELTRLPPKFDFSVVSVGAMKGDAGLQDVVEHLHQIEDTAKKFKALDNIDQLNIKRHSVLSESLENSTFDVSRTNSKDGPPAPPKNSNPPSPDGNPCTLPGQTDNNSKDDQASMSIKEEQASTIMSLVDSPNNIQSDNYIGKQMNKNRQKAFVQSNLTFDDLASLETEKNAPEKADIECKNADEIAEKVFNLILKNKKLLLH